MSVERLPHAHGKTEHMEKLRTLLAREEFASAAELAAQLGDASRMRIYWLLCHCEQCVINISALVGMSSPAVSHHLKQLKASGLIISRRAGKEVYYKAADSTAAILLHDTIEKLLEMTCPQENK